MGTTKLVLPKGHQDLDITPAMEQEMMDVQRELDLKGNQLAEGKIHFIITKGFYKHDKKLLTLASVIVNKTEHDIKGLDMNLKIALRERPEAQFSTMTVNLDDEFLGLIQSNEAFILHINIPANNVSNKDEIYEPTDLTGEIENLNYYMPQS